MGFINESLALLAVAVVVVALILVGILFTTYAFWLRARNTFRARRWTDRERRWTDLTLEAVVGERTAEELAAQVGGRERLPFLEFLLRYARRLKGRERERVKELAVPFLPALLPLLSDRDVYLRARAVQTLATLGVSEHATTLLKALKDDSPVVSMLAARGLAAFGGARYTEPILSNFDRFEHWGTGYVTSLLVSLGPEAAPELREIMADEERTLRIRVLAADALRGLHDLGAVSLAGEILGREPQTDLAAALLRLISVLGGTSEVELVRDVLDHPHFAVRAEAYSALGALAGEESSKVLEEGLEDPSSWVVLRAARGIRGIGGASRLQEISTSNHPGAQAAAQVLAEED